MLMHEAMEILFLCIWQSQKITTSIPQIGDIGDEWTDESSYLMFDRH